MSRGSEIVIGLVAGLLAAVLMLVAFVSGDTVPIGFLGVFVMSLFFVCVSAACLFETGRWLTTRITAGGIALVIIAAAVSDLASGEWAVGQIGKKLILVLLGIACGFFAVTDRYPDEMPLSGFFTQPKKAQPRKRKKKRPRRQYDYE